MARILVGKGWKIFGNMDFFNAIKGGFDLEMK
jgi:hypothetical protein